jgi:hypothetical protein
MLAEGTNGVLELGEILIVDDLVESRLVVGRDYSA